MFPTDTISGAHSRSKLSSLSYNLQFSMEWFPSSGKSAFLCRHSVSKTGASAYCTAEHLHFQYVSLSLHHLLPPTHPFNIELWNIYDILITFSRRVARHLHNHDSAGYPASYSKRSSILQRPRTISLSPPHCYAYSESIRNCGGMVPEIS